MNRLILVLGLSVAIGTMLAATWAQSSAQADTLGTVKARGVLNCGANGQLPGFGLPDAQGTWTGFDVDYCHAIAAAVFNDPTKVKFVPLTAKDRFTALQSGDVDVLIRNTTWTSSRETLAGLNATGANYIDGQGFIVRKMLKVNSALELGDASVCVQQGTTTELNLADYFRANRMRLKTVTFATLDEALKAYDSGRCDALTTDASGLYSVRLKLGKVDDHIVLPEIISKEPLSPYVRRGASWFDIVKWVHFVLLNAESSTSAGPTSTSSSIGQSRDQAPARHRSNYGEQFGLTKVGPTHHQTRRNWRIFERNLGQVAFEDHARAQRAMDQGRIQMLRRSVEIAR